MCGRRPHNPTLHETANSGTMRPMVVAKKIGFWLLVGGLVFALLPIAAALLAVSLASLAGCGVHEGAVEACRVLGLDIGGLLYALAVSAWYALFAVPLGAGSVFVGLITYLVARIALPEAIENAKN